MGVVTVCGISGGENYMDILTSTPGHLRNIWMKKSGQNWDFGEIKKLSRDRNWLIFELTDIFVIYIVMLAYTPLQHTTAKAGEGGGDLK